jgi:hypothetical protein
MAVGRLIGWETKLVDEWLETLSISCYALYMQSFLNNVAFSLLVKSRVVVAVARPVGRIL